jgi:hypothetical protein
MASLKELLAEVLPTLLPEDPQSAINGTTLLGLVQPKLQGEYSEASIRQHFSVMAGDATSPIAKVSQGHGYYRRPQPAQPLQDAVQPPGVVVEDQAEQESTRNQQREERFRALFIRYAEINNRFPVHIEHTTAIRRAAGVNKWKFPDVVVLDWDVGRISDSGYQIDRGLLEVKRSLGDQPFRLTSVELKVGLTLSTFRESFFQCVSNSKWAHHAYLVTANSLQDETLVKELRRLGTSFDISVISYGMSCEDIDALPNADQVLRSSDQEIEQMASCISITRVSSGRPREALDWEHIEDVRTQSRDFNDVFVWISRCLLDGKPYAFSDFRQISSVEAGYT